MDFELLYPLARVVGHRGNKKHQAKIKGNECVVNRIFLKRNFHEIILKRIFLL